MQYLEIDGYKISYMDVNNVNASDDDEAIVILQGWGTTMDVYVSVINLLSQKFRVITLNLPGFGDSTEPDKAWSVYDFSDFFIRFASEIGIKRSVLIGHSYGGRMIIDIASRDQNTLPFEITRIVLVDAAGIVPKKTKEQEKRIASYKRKKAVANLPVIKDVFKKQIEDWKSRQGSEDYRNASEIMRACLVLAVNEDMKHLMPNVKKEVLLIWGENDTATPIADAKTMEELLPNAGLAVIKNAGHYSFLDQPIVFSNILKSYFSL